MLPAFSNKALDQQEPPIRVYVDLLIDKLHGAAATGQSTNMVRSYLGFTMRSARSHGREDRARGEESPEDGGIDG